MVGTDQKRALLHIANTLEIGGLALTGKTRRLSAVEAGKPFAELQRHDIAPAELPINLRAVLAAESANRVTC